MISLVICTYNREKYLPKVLKSILDQTCNVSEFEIILINNNCTDTTEAICTEFKSNNPTIDFNYFVENNQGLSFARNRGYKESKYDLIAYLDDDAFIKKDYAQVALDFFKENNISAIGGKIFLDYEETPPNWENKYINSIFGYFNKGEKEFIFNGSDYPRGSNMVFKKSILEEVNGFNVNLGRTGKNMNGGEEKDIFNKIYSLKKSKVYYLPNLIVYHTVPEFRTKLDFVEKQASGIGQAERIRTKDNNSYLKRIFIELYKWGGTIALFFIYLLKLSPSKGIILIKFRYWISRGLFSNKFI